MSPDTGDFLASAEGETARLIREHDWASTPLGPIESWPQSLKTATGLLIAAPIPIVMLWGPEGVMIYNDAYSVFAGGRHPQLLGCNVREGWPEVADFNDNVMKVGLAGGTLAYKDQELTLYRHGGPEQVWMDLDYWPVPGDDGKPAGVIATVVETTGRVEADRARNGLELRQQVLLELNDAIRDLTDPAEIAQASAGILAEAMKVSRVGYGVMDTVAETVTIERDYNAPGVKSIAGVIHFRDFGDYIEDLARGEVVVFDDGGADPRVTDGGAALDSISARALINLPLIERGQVVALLFVNNATPRHWSEDDVALVREVAERVRTATERARATVELRRNAERLRFLDALNVEVSKITSADEVLTVTTRMTAQHLKVANCAYADMDADQDGFTIRGDWAEPGMASIVGHYQLADFGALAVRELGAGRPLIINDNLTEIAPEEAATFQAIGIGATICMPLVKEGRLTALMAVHHRGPHHWTEEELDTIREVTERSWAHVERVRSEAALREEKRALEILNEAGALVAADHELSRVVQRVTDAGVALSGAQFGAFFYNVLNDAGESYMLYALSGAPAEAFSRFPMPRNTAIFAPTFNGEGIVRSDDITRDPRYGQNAPRRGMPEGHLPVRSYLAVPVKSRTGEVLGGLFFGHAETGRFGEDAERGLAGLAGQAAIAIDNARLFQAAEAEITRRRLAEAELQSLNANLEGRVAETLAERKLLADVVESVDAFVQVIDPDFRWLAVNRAAADEFERVFGRRPKVGESLLEVLEHLPEEVARFQTIWRRALAGAPVNEVMEVGDPARARSPHEIRLYPLRDAQGDIIGAFKFGYDVTERLGEQARLREAEEALRQSQKMEAVGQLTGGIAHDFNNLLAGISGSLELLSKRLSEGRLNGMERYIDAAQGATQRAASLTQRLLAFSRRQTLDPKPTDVNRLIQGMDDLIRRSIGPDVELEVVGAGGLWATKVDPSQLENALLNLCINARDAMAPDGGRLTIETSNKWLDDRASRDRELPPGQYVSLCVTDTGTGMTPEVQAQVFDPFFTTKPMGQGTGLGLSMIHGFVRQSGGQVRIYSELGKGTTMCLYLPRYLGEVDGDDDVLNQPVAEGGHGETVLVIDDEETVRMLVAEVLGDAGYRVIEAPDGPSGLDILRSDRRIDLLISDVGLPGGMNGRQVADAARETRPDLKVLFITGYAENAAVGNGLLAPGMEVMTKPFVMADLALKVHEMIEGQSIRTPPD